jgi:hypothetical protein
MEFAGNPWGTYIQDEPCIFCGAVLVEPERRSFLSKVCSGVAARLDKVQMSFASPHGNWIHMVYSKD